MMVVHQGVMIKPAVLNTRPTDKKTIQPYNNLILSWTLETPSPKEERWLNLKKKKKENLSQETTYAQIPAKKQNIIENQDNVPNPKVTNLIVMDVSENN